MRKCKAIVIAKYNSVVSILSSLKVETTLMSLVGVVILYNLIRGTISAPKRIFSVGYAVRVSTLCCFCRHQTAWGIIYRYHNHNHKYSGIAEVWFYKNNAKFWLNTSIIWLVTKHNKIRIRSSIWLLSLANSSLRSSQ